MSDQDKLAALRVSKLKDNTDARPVDVLRAAIHDIETGATKCTGVIVIMADTEAWDTMDMRAGLKWQDEMTLLQLALTKHLLRQFDVRSGS